MRIHRLFITLFFQIFLVNGDSISYEEALLLKIYDNREHIRNIYSDCYNVTCCNSVSCSTVIYRDTCPFENKDLLLSLLDSAYTSWEKYRSEIIASVFSLRGDNVLLRTAMNKSRVINDSLYVYLLSCYLGLNDSRLKNSALDVLLNNTAYIQLKKNSKAIKQGLKEGEFDNKSEEKEKRLKLLALLDLSEKEKAMILNDNLLTKRQRMRIEEKIKKHKGEVNNSLTLESYCIKENIRYVLPLELKARLGEVNAAYELMKIYDLHATNNKKLLSKKMRELGEQYPIYPPELIVENLIYTGLDTCLKYLILNFNAPLYKYREVMVSINPKRGVCP